MMENKSKRRHRLNNKGYSLVEMIITIGIIVVMTGAAVGTMFMISSAKAKEASVTFTSQLSNIATKAKNQTIVIDGTSYPNYNYCLKLYQSGNKCYVQVGYYNSDAGEPGESNYTPIADENNNNGKGASLSSKVSIVYTNAGGVKTNITGDNAVYIAFNRTGACVEGNGTYSFYKKNGNLVGDVKLNKNGSYQSE